VSILAAKLYAGRENINAGREKLNVGREKVDVGRENINVGREKVDAEREKLNVEREKVDFAPEIRDLYSRRPRRTVSKARRPGGIGGKAIRFRAGLTRINRFEATSKVPPKSPAGMLPELITRRRKASGSDPWVLPRSPKIKHSRNSCHCGYSHVRIPAVQSATTQTSLFAGVTQTKLTPDLKQIEK
jgi:hypothetical protein